MKDFELGVPELDREHALQLELVRSFRAAAAKGVELGALSGILERLADYTNAHFLAEQLLMRLRAYPGYAAHVQEHDRLIEQLGDLQDAFAGGARAATAAAADELERWLSVHVQTSDQAFARFLNETAEAGGRDA